MPDLWKNSEMTECKQSFELFSCFCRLIKEEEVKKWKEHADKMRKGKDEIVYFCLLFSPSFRSLPPPKTGLTWPLTSWCFC